MSGRSELASRTDAVEGSAVLTPSSNSSGVASPLCVTLWTEWLVWFRYSPPVLKSTADVDFGAPRGEVWGSSSVLVAVVVVMMKSSQEVQVVHYISQPSRPLLILSKERLDVFQLHVCKAVN